LAGSGPPSEKQSRWSRVIAGCDCPDQPHSWQHENAENIDRVENSATDPTARENVVVTP
jgi:hypothetical protein